MKCIDIDSYTVTVLQLIKLLIIFKKQFSILIHVDSYCLE